MTIREILSLPTENLEALDDKALSDLLSPLLPAARNPDKESAAKKDMGQLIKQAQLLLNNKCTTSH